MKHEKNEKKKRIVTNWRVKFWFMSELIMVLMLVWNVNYLYVDRLKNSFDIRDPVYLSVTHRKGRATKREWMLHTPENIKVTKISIAKHLDAAHFYDVF